MKSFRFYALSGMALLSFLLVARPGAAPKSYLFGIHSPGEGYFASSLKSGFSAGSEAFTRRTGFAITFDVFKDLQTYYTAIGQGRVDIVFTISEAVFLRASGTGRYQPLIGYEVFGRPSHQYCLWVAKTSPVKSVKELKGKVATTYEDEWAYVQLQDLVKARPEQFFGRLDVSPGGTSSFYALSLGQVEAAFIHTAALGLMQAINPGPTKKARALACGPAHPMPPLMALKSLPKVNVEETRRELLGISTSPAYASVKPLMNKLKMRFKPAEQASFAPMLKRYKQAQADGSLKRHADWSRLAVRRK